MIRNGEIRPEQLTVTFIDVGQGDSALVECGGEAMLIDVGPNTRTVSGKIRQLLLEKDIYTLKYLVISHLHEDHYGGLVGDALKNVEIQTTLCNEDPYKLSHVGSHLGGSRLIVPKKGETYTLGGATVTVVDACAGQPNDSLVLLISYGDTGFLFTGDIEKEAHSRVSKALRDMSAELGKEVLIKMPHHGAYNSDPFLPDNASDNSLATLVSAAHATHFVISVGKNDYGHPDRRTLELIRQALHGADPEAHLFRTDENGDIAAVSNGKTITVAPSRMP